MLSSDDHYKSVLFNFDDGIEALERAEGEEVEAEGLVLSPRPPVTSTSPPHTPRGTLKTPRGDNPDSQPALKCPMWNSPLSRVSSALEMLSIHC
jgi:hypothetical protein